MTKNVKYQEATWSKMTTALKGISGHEVRRGAMDYTYDSDDGFNKLANELIDISEKAKNLINKYDVDGVISFNYHDDKAIAKELHESLLKLEKYSTNVSKYLNEKIDRPFYESMDKVAEKLCELNIGTYKIPNTVGFKKTEVLGTYNNCYTKDIAPDEIGIKELYKVESPYKLKLEQSYEQFKASEAYKDNKLNIEDFTVAMHNTRGFAYQSLNNKKEKLEFWRDLCLGGTLVFFSFVCPLAGGILGITLAGLDVNSAISGKDWGTGRELNRTERVFRAGFAIPEFIPVFKNAGNLSKVFAKSGLIGAKTSAKAMLKESLEHGVRNVNKFKFVLSNTKSIGKHVVKNIPEYSRNLVRGLKDTIDDNIISISKKVQRDLEKVKSFSLNFQTPKLQLAGVGDYGGRFSIQKSVGDTALGHTIDNIIGKANDVEVYSLKRINSRNFGKTYGMDNILEIMDNADYALKTDVHGIDAILTQRDVIRNINDGIIELSSNMRKGNYGEMVTDEVYRLKGYERISKEITIEIDTVTHFGIDGIYYKADGIPPFIIAESKFNTARLNYLKSNGKIVGKQMDREWIMARLKDAIDEDLFENLKIAYENNEVGTQLVRVKKNVVIISDLDKSGNIIRKIP